MGLDGLCKRVEWDKVVLGVVFFIKVGFDGLWAGHAIFCNMTDLTKQVFSRVIRDSTSVRPSVHRISYLGTSSRNKFRN